VATSPARGRALGTRTRLRHGCRRTRACPLLRRCSGVRRPRSGELAFSRRRRAQAGTRNRACSAPVPGCARSREREWKMLAKQRRISSSASQARGAAAERSGAVASISNIQKGHGETSYEFLPEKPRARGADRFPRRLSTWRSRRSNAAVVDGEVKMQPLDAAGEAVGKVISYVDIDVPSGSVALLDSQQAE